MAMPTWIHEAQALGSTLGGLAAAVIAYAGLRIAHKQSQTSAAKLKLDLYERRFAIYAAALDCYSDVFRGSADANNRIAVLVRATREAQFHFVKTDGVFDTLNSLREWCQNWQTIRESESKTDSFGRDKEQSKYLRGDPKNATPRGEQLMLELEKKLAPYLSFEQFR